MNSTAQRLALSALLLLVCTLMATSAAAFGAPIDGVVVLAQWKLDQETLGGGINDFNKIQTFETVTDGDGRFFIPAWGPAPRPPFSYLTRATPEFRIFKPGYFPQVLANRYAVAPEAALVVSDWNNKTIALKTFDGDYARYARGLYSLWSMRSEDCVRLCPRLILATDAEWRRIRPRLPTDLHLVGPFPMHGLDADDRAVLEQVLGGPLPGSTPKVTKKRASSSAH